MTRFSMYSGERIQSDRLSVDFDTMAGVYQPPDLHNPGHPGEEAEANHRNNHELLQNGTHGKKQQQRKVQPKQMRHLNGNGKTVLVSTVGKHQSSLSRSNR